MMEQNKRSIWNPKTYRALLEFRKQVAALEATMVNEAADAMVDHGPQLWELLDDVCMILDEEGLVL